MPHKFFTPVCKCLYVTGFLMVITGCASTKQPHLDYLKSSDENTQSCAQFYQQLDAMIDQAGVRDRGARLIAGFPYLRINRFLASFKEQAVDDPELGNAWIKQLKALDLKGRGFEIANLSEGEMQKLGKENTISPDRRLQECAELFWLKDKNNQEVLDLLSQRARVPDDYSTAKRVLGLYALTRYPFYLGVEDWQEETEQAIQLARKGKPAKNPVQYYSPPNERVFTSQEVRRILARAKDNALGIISLSETERQRLFQTYAPVYQVETEGNFDRIGTVNWSDKETPQVDISMATVYTRLEYTRVQNQTLLQLVYVAWMPERPRKSAFDLLGGHLDGLVWRVTLAPDGEPIIYDSIHPCGCYHLFFTTPRVKPIPAPAKTVEWAFTPLGLPRIKPGERVTLSVQARNHYLRDVWPTDTRTGVTYRIADYDNLRMLPYPDGTTQSIFGPDGLIAGSERRERFLFWPMGIKNAGAMRQAGTQATAFVGRRHFDDADLIDKRFRLLPSSQP